MQILGLIRCVCATLVLRLLPLLCGGSSLNHQNITIPSTVGFVGKLIKKRTDEKYLTAPVRFGDMFDGSFAISSALELSKYPTEHVIRTIQKISSHEKWNSMTKDLGFVSVLVEIVTSAELEESLHVMAENLLSDLLANHGDLDECRVNNHLAVARALRRSSLNSRKSVLKLEKHLDVCRRLASSPSKDTMSILGAAKTISSLVDHISQDSKKCVFAGSLIKSLNVLDNLIDHDNSFAASNAQIIVFNSTDSLKVFSTMLNAKDERVSNAALAFFEKLLKLVPCGLHPILCDLRLDLSLVNQCLSTKHPSNPTTFWILSELATQNVQIRNRLARNHSFVDLVLNSFSAQKSKETIEHTSRLFSILCQSIIHSRACVRKSIRDRYFVKLVVLFKSPNPDVVLSCLRSLRILSAQSKQISDAILRLKAPFVMGWLSVLCMSKNALIAQECRELRRVLLGYF